MSRATSSRTEAHRLVMLFCDLLVGVPGEDEGQGLRLAWGERGVEVLRPGDRAVSGPLGGRVVQ